MIKKVGKQEHHLWSKRDSAGSGQKALNLVRMVWPVISSCLLTISFMKIYAILYKDILSGLNVVR